MPFVVTWKGTLPAGKVYDPLVIQLDILPTALAAAGIDFQTDSKLDGVNLLPYLTEKTTGIPHDTLYWRLGPQMAIRTGDWKLVRYLREFAAEEPAAEVTAPRFYNLRQDVGETKDLATAQPGKVQELQALWDQWAIENRCSIGALAPSEPAVLGSRMRVCDDGDTGLEPVTSALSRRRSPS